VGRTRGIDAKRRIPPWKVTAAHTRVFKFYTGHLLSAPQAEIDAAIADLNRRRIAIAVEDGVS
jgi:hypothetical protein